MYSSQEWSEVFWGLAAELEKLTHCEVDAHSFAPAFTEHMRDLEEEERRNERFVLYEEKLDRIASEFLNLFFERPHSATGRDVKAVMWQHMRVKAQELLQTIDARVGEEPGIAY